jgi:hypothetical protein
MIAKFRPTTRAALICFMVSSALCCFITRAADKELSQGDQSVPKPERIRLRRKLFKGFDNWGENWRG